MRLLSRERAERLEASERLRSAVELHVQRFGDAGGGGGDGDALGELMQADEDGGAVEAVWRLAEQVAMQAIWKDSRSVAMSIGPTEAWACHSVYVDDEGEEDVARDLGLTREALSSMLEAACRRMDAAGWRLPRIPSM